MVHHVAQSRGRRLCRGGVFLRRNGQPVRHAKRAGRDAQGCGHKYKTRLIVRRPIDPKKFNGTVLAEWQNVTAGYDLDAHWESTFEQIVRGGYAWVGISAQRVGVQQPPNGLKLYSPTRYASLDVTDGGTITNDGLSYDIYRPGYAGHKHPQGVNPLGP